MKRFLKRISALLFSAIFILQGIPAAAYAADDPDLANWSIRLDFVDPEDDQNLTDDYTLNVDANSYGTNQIKLQVTIKYTGDGSVTYAPGDVHFTLNDLRDIICFSPSQYYGYDIAAELVGSDSGRGDWYYTEDYVSKYTVKENTFNFTNKEEISGAFTSTFQIVMRPYLRYAPAEYAKTLETELSFDNISGTVPSNKAMFTYHGTKSTFSLGADYAKVDDGLRDPILGKIPDDKTTDDYIFAEMKFKAPYITEKIAHIHKTKLEADFPDDVIVSDTCRVDTANSGVFSNATPSIDENNYTVISSTLSENCPMSADDAYSFTILIAFPRDKYLEMGSYTQHFTLNGQFYNENYTQIAETDLVFNFSELNYIWKPGSLYNMEKSAYGFDKSSLSETYYDRNYVYENMTYSYANTDYVQSKRFDISATAIYTGKPYDIVIGDDLQYLVYPDNTYRRLEDDERIVTKVSLPSSLAGLDAQLYGRKPGTDTYELYKSWTVNTSYSNLNISITERYCDVKLKFTGITKTLDNCVIYVYLGTMINENNEGESVPAKVYNLSYMDILINDTVQSIERIAVDTNITGLADDIDAYDNESYGRLLYRSADYKTILPGKAGVHQSQGSSSYYNEDTEVTDKYVYITYGTVPVFYDYQAGGNTWCDFQDKYTLPAGWDTDPDDMAFYFSLNSGEYTDIRLADGQSFRLSKIIQYKDLPEALKSQISVNKETDVDGKVVLTVHYDFTENPIVNKGETFVLFKPFFKIRIDLDTFQMLDLNGKSVKLVHDRTINQDSNTTVFANTSRKVNDLLKCPSIAYSTYQGVSIESSVGGGSFDKTDKTISNGQNYEYKLRFATSSSKVKNLVFFDRLDGAYGSEEHWQGVFQGVNVTALAALGITPDIYYSVNADQSSDLSSSGWVKSSAFTEDLEKVKAVAIDLGENIISPGSMVFAKIKMKAPDDMSLSGVSAYNNTSVSYKAYDSSLTVLTDDNVLENVTDLTSNTAKITIKSDVCWAYVDGVSGDDANDGCTPETAVKTFEQAYENIKTTGGTIYVVDTVTLADQNYTMTDSRISGTRAVTLDEGMSVKISRYSQPDTVTAGFNITDNLNTLIYIPETANLKLENLVIDGHKNAITESEYPNFIAGSVSAEYPVITNEGSLTLSDGAYIQNNLIDCSRQVFGGGIYSSGALNMNGGTVTSNEGNYMGGGIYSSTAGTINFTKASNITKNKAVMGGGIYSLSSITLNEYALLTENVADFGGGIYMYNDTLLTFDGGCIENNKASEGGGVWLQFSDMLMKSGKISDNETEWAGGGVYLNGTDPENGRGLFTMKGGEITGNKTGQRGAGVHNYCGAFVMDDGLISLNGPLSVDSEIWGGGVSLDGDGTLTMNSGEISHNKANEGGGVYLVPYGVITRAYIQGDSLITENEAEYGGGIMNYAAELHVSENAVISKNTATSGGGVYNYGNPDVYTKGGNEFFMEGGTITDNHAKKGSGVFNGAYYQDDTAGGSMYMTGGTITDNRPADTSGSTEDAVYNWKGTIEMSGGLIEKSKIGIYNDDAVTTLSAAAKIETCDNYSVYQKGVLQVKETPKAVQPVFLTPDHFITVIGTCTSSFITAMAEDDTFEGRVLANYTFETSDQDSLYTLDPPTKGVADSLEIEVGDKAQSGGKYPYCVLLVNTVKYLHITYDPNGGSGEAFTETVTIGDSYTVPSSDFSKDNAKLIGWDKDNNATSPSFKPGDELTDVLAAFNITDPQKNNYITLYAIWDSNPVIEYEPLSFYEGEHVTKKDLLKTVTASDAEDGDITGDIKITDLTYSEGRIVDGVKTTEKEKHTWESDMPGGFILDTWFMQLDKEDSPVSHNITYEVKDSGGSACTYTGVVNVIYNEPPEISGITKCFFSVDEANEGKITKEALLDDLIADGKLTVTDMEDDIWYPGTLTDKLVLLDYDERQFKNIDGPAYQILHYLVVDSLGKEDTYELKVYIIDEGEITNGLDTENVRFIDEDNYVKNIDLFKEELTADEIAAALSNGGLPIASIWYTNSEYAQCISDIFGNIKNNSPVKTYTYSSKDVSKLKASPAVPGAQGE